MENKKTYKAPLAEIVLFAPCEDLSVFFGNKKENAWWNLDTSAWWGLKTDASVITGTLGITDEDGKIWEYDGTLKN